MVLAHAVELDVAYHHHRFVRLLEQGVANDVGNLLLVSPREPAERVRDTTWGLCEPVAVRILAHELELPPHQRLELLVVRGPGVEVEGLVRPRLIYRSAVNHLTC